MFNKIYKIFLLILSISFWDALNTSTNLAWNTGSLSALASAHQVTVVFANIDPEIKDIDKIKRKIL